MRSIGPKRLKPISMWRLKLQVMIAVDFLNEVLQAVSESKTIISAVSGRSDKNKMATIHMTILIKNIDHLQSVVEKIKRVKDVYSVQRIMQS